ncbi:hypothetical protein BDU57DRAFT_498082 [Ampelomyces quisqualis]|uniref:BTB domain-containing protein n=1 Tax=Ampelomyces quisqualis TaxID=50730 RepID=A0A6A5QMD7_AMPQU|nr:hypothetical protein BDU57DRAFT_498082 [Ampelomyces quisqualis]
MAPPPTSPQFHIPVTLERKATDTLLETITVDSMYNLTVGVGTPEHPNGQKAFQINKGSFRNVSPVCAKVLSGKWKESNFSKIDFPEDNCNAFLIMPQIAHFQFHQLPANLSVSGLVELALLTDKYELSNEVCIGLDMKKWLQSYHKPGAVWPPNTSLQEFAIITSAFQMQEDFRYLSNRLAMEVEVNESGSYYLVDEKQNKVTRKRLSNIRMLKHTGFSRY